MGEVIDVRANRFLQEMRKHGSWEDACAGSGMSPAEAGNLCSINPKFDLSQVEAQLEYVEKQYTEEIEAVVAKVRIACMAEFKLLRKNAMQAYNERHREE